jgi:hypothetical protein
MYARNRSFTAVLMVWLVYALTGPAAMAQNFYTFDPNNADEATKPGIRYFGAAKDESGKLVSGATIVLEYGQASFIFVTDEQGRFKTKLPLEAVAAKVSAQCSKSGFKVERVTKRRGPAEGAIQAVQVDCMLRRAA